MSAKGETTGTNSKTLDGNTSLSAQQADIAELTSQHAVIQNLDVTNLNAQNIHIDNTSTNYYLATDSSDQFRTNSSNMDFTVPFSTPTFNFKGTGGTGNSIIQAGSINGKNFAMSNSLAGDNVSTITNTSSGAGSASSLSLATPSGSVSVSMDESTKRGIIRTHDQAFGLDLFTPSNLDGFVVSSGAIEVLNVGNTGVETIAVSTPLVNVTNLTNTDTLRVLNTADATSVTAPTIMSGGALIQKSCWADTFATLSSQDSTSRITGAITTFGGLGVAKTINALALVADTITSNVSTSAGALTATSVASSGIITAPTITATATVSGAIVSSGLNSMTPAGITLGAGGLAIAAGNITVNPLGGISVSGAPPVAGTVSAAALVAASAILTSLTTVTASISGSATINSPTFTGTTTFSTGFTAPSAHFTDPSLGLAVDKSASIGGTLSVTGPGNAFQVTNNATISGSLGVNGSGGLVVTNTTTTGNIIVGSGGRLKLATSTADTTLLGVDVTNDSTNTSITLVGTTASSNPGSILYKAKEAGAHIFTGTAVVGPFVDDTKYASLFAGYLTLNGQAPGTLLTVSGPTSLVDVTSTGISTLNTVNVTGTGTALTVQNNTVMNGNLTVNGTLTTSGSITTTGSTDITANSITLLKSSGTGLGVSANAVIGGTINVTGSGTFGSIVNNGNQTIAGTLGVTGATTTSSITALGLVQTSVSFASNAGTSSGTGIAHYRFQSGGNDRWAFGLANTESGSNSGSDLRLFNYTDAGVTIGNVVNVTRSTGLLTLSNGLAIAAGGFAVTGNSTIAGTFGVTGNTTITGTLTSTGGFLAPSGLFNQASGLGLAVTANATVGGALTVTGAGNAFQVTNNSTIGGSLGINGVGTALVVANSVSVGGNQTITGTLGVTGATTLGALTASSVSCTNNATVGGTLGVTGKKIY